MESEQRFDHLREHSIGFAQVLFQSITHMAPAAAVAFSLLVGFGFAGPVLPLSVIFALAVGLLIANSVGQLAKQMPSAGGALHVHQPGLGIEGGLPGRMDLPSCRTARCPSFVPRLRSDCG